MGFLDKAKELADQAVAKADAAMGSATAGTGAKQAEGYFRDLGVLAYLDATGRSAGDAEEQRQRCTTAIQQIESQSPLNLTMSSVAPPAPGVAAAAPPPPGAAAAPVVPPPPPGAVPPPPPPGTV